MYTSEWRGHMTSDVLCDEAQMQCTGNVFNTNAAPHRQGALLTALAAALLLILVIFNV